MCNRSNNLLNFFKGSLYHKIKLSDLDRAAGFLNWTNYFSNAFSKVDHPVDGETEVVVHASLYLANMTLLGKQNMIKRGFINPQRVNSAYVDRQRLFTLCQCLKTLTP